MLRKEKHGVVWLEFEHLSREKGLKHAIFLRKGGVSKGPFESLNTSALVGDTPEQVKENLDIMAKTLEVGPITFCSQVHGKTIQIVTQPLIEEKEGDALITATSKVAIGCRHADCQPAIFYDPSKQVVATVHAGWKGNVINIYQEVLDQLASNFKTQAKDLLVGIGPSLGPCHAEFIHYKKEFPEAFWKFQVSPNYFDLWEIGQQQLLEGGVLKQNIECAKMCTYAAPEDFFSYRRDKICGRHATVACLT